MLDVRLVGESFLKGKKKDFGRRGECRTLKLGVRAKN